MHLKASVQWAPRAANSEADAFANGNVESFNPDFVCWTRPDILRWCILPNALEMERGVVGVVVAVVSSGSDAELRSIRSGR